MFEGGRKFSLFQKSKVDSSGVGKGDLQFMLLEGYGIVLFDLDFFVINDKSIIRKMLQLVKIILKKFELISFFVFWKKSLDLFEVMEMMEFQILLLMLFFVKMENNFVEFERRVEKNLLIMCKEKEKLQKKVYELKCRFFFFQRKWELVDVLDVQIDMFSFFEVVVICFKE